MDETGEHCLQQSYPGTKSQKLHVLPHIQIIDQNKCSNIIGHGSHTKGRMHTGEIGKGNLKLECGWCAPC
jgi:hypothetical protein